MSKVSINSRLLIQGEELERTTSQGSRRALLLDATRISAAASFFALSACEAKSTPQVQTQSLDFDLSQEHGPKGNVLNAFQWRILDAAQDALLPSIGENTGARKVNAIQYLDLALEHPRFKWPKKKLRSLALYLDKSAQKKFSKTYSQLNLKDRDALLHAAVADTQKRNVRLLLDITLEALLGDPVHGGNQDEEGWKSVGFTPPWPRPENRASTLQDPFPT